MTTERALDLALEALECFDYPAHDDDVNKIEAAIAAIKQARSAPLQPCNPAEDGVCEALECCEQPAPVSLNRAGIQKLLEQSGFDKATPEERAAFISGIRHRESEILDTQPAQPAPVCNPHPKAPHGFNRSASHSADRYVCDCEGWDAYDAGYQAGIEDTYKRMDALDKKAENARELGLDYEPADGTQVSKVWWDGEKLMAKPIPLVDFYQPVQDSTCSETLRAQGKAYPRTCRKCGKGPCIGAPKPPPAAQRQWVGLTEEEREQHRNDWRSNIHDKEFRAIEAKLKEKNT